MSVEAKATDFETIVVGTDGSDNAARALSAAAGLAAGTNSAVHVLTSYQPLTPAQQRSIAAQLPDELKVLVHAHVGAETILGDAQQIMEAADVDATYHEVDDDPSDAIIKKADEMGADLIVVGSRGEGAALRALHGSVSTKVLHHAECSVLVVK